MKGLFSKVLASLERGEPVALCTLLEASGPTPRGAGAKMAVFEDGSIAGTIGGGALEYRALQDGKALLAGGDPGLCGYELDGGPLDMVCGGRTRALFQRLDMEDRPWIEAARALLDEPRASWLLTALEGGRVRGVGVYDRERGLRFFSGVDETALTPFLRRKPVFEDGLFVEPLGRAGKVYVFGGGHVAQELVPLLGRVGFRTLLCEDRPEFATRALFPTADEIVELGPGALTGRFDITADDCLVIMTRGHRDDYKILLGALATQAGYIGVIGSHRKAALTFEHLRRDGYREADIARVRTPIGLPIGAETPAEIAVSVVAELIAHRASQASERGA